MTGTSSTPDSLPSSMVNSASASRAIDSSNPYFLHHSDNPGMSLVSQELNGDNFQTWHQSMIIALSAKNKLCFVDGTKPAPDSDHSDFLLWKQCNNMVKSWLINSVAQDIRYSVVYAVTAEEIWKELKDRYAQCNAPRIYQIRRDIALCNQDNKSIAAYYTTLKSMWDELSSLLVLPTCTCGGSSKAFTDYHQQEHIINFLMGLNESYNGIRGQILLMDPLPTVNKAYALILQEEKQRSVAVPSPTIADSTAFSASFGNQRGRGNSYKQHGHRRRLYCDHCGGTNHSKETCYILHGYPPGHRSYKSGHSHSSAKSTPSNQNLTPSSQTSASSEHKLTSEQYHQLMNLLNEGKMQPSVNMAGPAAEDDDWHG